MYLFGVLFIRNFVLVFILTLLLLSLDFYYLKNIAGRRLVGLRWWNEVNTATGDSHWVFESAPEGSRTENKTDKRFFWLSMYTVPALWVALAILAIVRLQNLIWLVTNGMFIWFPLSLCVICVNASLRSQVYLFKYLLLCASYSHRIGPHNHKHSRLFALRQVQPGLEFCRVRVSRRRHCPWSC